MRVWQLMRQSIHSATRSRLRSGLTAMGIAIASGALVSMVSFALGLQQQMEAPFTQLGLLNNIEVRPKDADEAEEDSAEPAPPLDDEALRRLEAIPGVEYAYPDFRLSEVKICHGDRTRTAFAMGLPREASVIASFGDLLVAGRYFSLASEPEALLGETLADDLGFAAPEQAIGQTLEVVAAGLVAADSNQFQLQRQRLEVRIVGVYRPPGVAEHLGARSILLPVELMRHLPGTVVERNLRRLRAREGAPLDGFAQVVVHTDRPSDVFRVERAIKKMGFETRALITQLKEARRFFVFMEVLLTAVGTVALVVAGLGIMNTLMMSVLERYQEIGIYKAIGASSGDIRILFLTEAAVVGLAGGLGGLVLARVVCWFLEWGVNAYAATQDVPGPMDLFDFPLWLLSGAVLFAIVVSTISGWYPASRAAKVDPIRALRGE